jgi:transcription elongation factor GreA
VASYGEVITPSAVKPVRAFLTYVWKKKYSTISLAPHLRPKKTSVRTVPVWQTEQSQATLSVQGYAKLEQELADLKTQRSEVLEEVKIAAADKDFRENAPLAAARERKARLEGRIKEIESILSHANIIQESQATTRAKFGDTVVLRNLSSGEESTYTLVDPREADPATGKLSVASPLGKAILHKEKGQTIEVATPAGAFCCRIEDILGPSQPKPC